MLFTNEEVLKVTRALYYPEYEQGDTYVYAILSGITDIKRKARILFLIDEIDSLSSQITEVINKSHLEQVDTIRFNYLAKIRLLKSEASRLLRELAMLAGLELKFDPYGSCGSYIKQSFF
jgi:hypothetical protein